MAGWDGFDDLSRRAGAWHRLGDLLGEKRRGRGLSDGKNSASGIWVFCSARPYNSFVRGVLFVHFDSVRLFD